MWQEHNEVRIVHNIRTISGNYSQRNKDMMISWIIICIYVSLGFFLMKCFFYNSTNISTHYAISHANTRQLLFSYFWELPRMWQYVAKNPNFDLWITPIVLSVTIYRKRKCYHPRCLIQKSILPLSLHENNRIESFSLQSARIRGDIHSAGLKSIHT